MERLTVDLEAEELAALDDLASGREADAEILRIAAGKVTAARGADTRVGTDTDEDAGPRGISGRELNAIFAEFRERTGGVDLDLGRRRFSDRPIPFEDES